MFGDIGDKYGFQHGEHVKPHAFGSRRIMNQEDTPSYGPSLGYFYAIGFLGPLALDDVLMNIL
jgi:hypothetical protein